MMKKYLIFAIPAFITNVISAVQFPLQGYTFLAPRSPSVNAARELVGWRNYINRADECWYGAFSVTPEYSQSFRSNRIAQYFFGDQLLQVSGSNLNNRNNYILADYFGLPQDFIANELLAPKLITGLIDFNLYLGYKDWYFRIHAPYCWMKTKFPINETVIEPGPSDPYPALYMDFGVVNPPNNSFATAIATESTWGQVSQGLKFGRIVCEQKKSSLAEVQMALGWNFINDACRHLGVNLRLYAPAGNRSKGLFLFEPIVGNGHHWEAGAGFTGHWMLWEKNEYQSIAIYLDFNMTHICKADQVRSFDFGDPHCVTRNANFGSRYILVKEFDASGNYTGICQPAINFTTLCCSTYNNLQMDFALMGAYSGCWLDVDFGYGFWLRSKEHLCLKGSIPENTIALKGIQNVAATITTLSNDTQSATATLEGDPFTEQAILTDDPSPQFVNTGDLNLLSATTPTAFTQKFFWNLSYAWKDLDCQYVAPFLGLGGQIEFESTRGTNTCSLGPIAVEPNQNSIAQWSLWVKGGIGF